MGKSIEINGKIFNYNIIPIGKYVYAEIYYTEFDKPHQIQVMKKEFGKFWRMPVEKDYDDAEDWCKKQMKYIFESNI